MKKNAKKTNSSKKRAKRRLPIPVQRALAVLSIVAFALVIFVTGFSLVRLTNILSSSSFGADSGTPTPTVDVTPMPDATSSPIPTATPTPYGVIDDVVNVFRPTQVTDGTKEKVRNIYTFLVCGTDIDNTRTDVLLLCQYDITAQSLKLLQIPRDSYIESDHYDKKITAIHAYDGMDALLDAIHRTFAVEVDFWVKVKISGFRELVDLIGGVEVYVDYNMDYEDPDQDLKIHLKKGLQTLDGKQAEGYVRYRHGYANGDIGRMNAQRKFLKAFVTQAFSLKNVTKIPDMIATCLEIVSTNASVYDLTYFATSALSLNMENISIFTAPGEPSYKAGDPHSYFTLYDDETIELIKTHFNPYTTELSDSDFSIVELSHKYSDSATDNEGTSFGELDETAPKKK